MSIVIKSIDDLREYFTAVVERGEHHGEQVKEALFPLMGFIIYYSDPSRKIRVKEYDSDMKNAIWVYINGTRYVFRYDHENAKIDICKDSLQGPVEEKIDNSWSHDDMKKIFKNL